MSEVNKNDDIEVSSNETEQRNKPASSSTSSENEKLQAQQPTSSADLSSALDSVLFPADSFTPLPNHTYWADLPFGEKTRWINNQSNAEAKRELKVIGRMFKADPLSPFTTYMSTYFLSGMGLFVEGFTLFSVGNLTPLFKAVWPECWKDHIVCDKAWISAVDYLSIVGIILGQILVGIEADWIGRKFGMVQDALVMTVGSIMLTAMWGTSLNGWIICYAWSLFLYGLGVGGEYPITGVSSVEGRGPGGTTGDRMHRGRNVVLAFVGQGWGQLVNQGILIVGLLAFNGSGLDAPFSKTATQWTFRVQFGFIAFTTLWLAYFRYYKMPDQDAELRAAKKRAGQSTSGYDVKSFKLAKNHYWHRMLGTAGSWFCNDFFFYGNKIFAGVFIGIITGGNSSLKTTWLYSLINIGVSLCGYYMAAFLIDHKQYGRKWMQANGFVADFILFIIAAALYDQLTEPGSGIRWFQAIYFLSSFFNQFGPNATTFLAAAELYPSSIRGTAHGVSAACGKLGALAPAILYGYIGNHTKFWVVSWFGLAGWLLTMVFIADMTGLDLREQERYWELVVKGKENEYHGVAVHPRHLSLYERVVLKRHLQYDAELDRQQKINELRAVYESTKDFSAEKGEHDLTVEQREFLGNEALGEVFFNEKKLSPNLQAQAGPHESKLADLENKLR